MGSLDIDSLERKFTTSPLKEIVKICTNSLFKETNIVHGLEKVNLTIFYLSQPKSCILYLTMYYTNKLVE